MTEMNSKRLPPAYQEKQSRQKPVALRSTLSVNGTSGKLSHRTQKAICTDLILTKLERAKDLPKCETQYLYRTASTHMSLPSLTPQRSEKEDSYLERVRAVIKSSKGKPPDSFQTTVSHRVSKTSKPIKLNAKTYEEIEARRKRREINRMMAKEMQTSREECNSMKCMPAFPDSIFDRDCLSRKEAGSLAERSSSLTIKFPDVAVFRENLIQQDALLNTKLNSEALKKARDRINNLMRTCNSIEEDSKKYEQLVLNCKSDITDRIEHTQAVSSVIDHDVINKFTEKELLGSKSNIYAKLEKRNKAMIKHLDSHIDIMTKFSKEEASLFLRRKQEGNDVYDSNMLKYLKNSYRKNAHKQNNTGNQHYLMYATKFISDLVENK